MKLCERSVDHWHEHSEARTRPERNSIAAKEAGKKAFKQAVKSKDRISKPVHERLGWWQDENQKVSCRESCIERSAAVAGVNYGEMVEWLA